MGGSYIPAHTTYAFNNQTIYYYNNTAYTNTNQFAVSVNANDATYTWSVTAGTANVSNTGVVTLGNNNTQNVTVRCRATINGVNKDATYTLTATATPALNETAYSDIAITPSSQTLDLGETATYAVSPSISRVTKTRPLYVTITDAQGHTHYKVDGAGYQATEPTITETPGAAINLTQVAWTFSGGDGNYYTPSTYNSSSPNLTLTRREAKTASDKTFTITATGTYGGQNKTATATVTIPLTWTDLTALHAGEAISLGIGETATAESHYTWEPDYDAAGAAYKNFTYTSADTSVATVDASGKVTAVGPGTTTITLQSIKIDGSTNTGVSCAITVNVAIDAPTISIDGSGNVTITHPVPGAQIRYTTDGSDPTPTTGTVYTADFKAGNEQTIKAIAVYNGVASSVASKFYATSGVSGGKVILNDYEDHNWSYYSDPESPVKSLYPRNAKITYYGNGTNTMTTDNNNPGATNMTNATGVQVSRYETENTFVYYKTLERYVPITNLVEGEPGTRYVYELIPNPFSKRPVYGTNATTKWRGFYGWRIKSLKGGAIYSAPTGGTQYGEGDILTTEYQKLYFQPDDGSTTNANNVTSMEVEFEAIWARAYYLQTSVANWTGTSGVASTTFQTGVSYERNFLVINSGTTSTANLSNTSQQPVTVMMVEPDGSADYRATTRYINPAYVMAQNSLKFEWMNMQVSNTLSANANNLVVGRGVLPAGAGGAYADAPLGNMAATGTNPNPTVTAASAKGLANSTQNANTSYSRAVDFTLRLESGVYTNIFYASNNGTAYGTMQNYTFHVRGFFGNDYDRAKKNNDRMVAKEAVLEGTSGGFTTTSTVNALRETMNLTMKSGTIGTNYNNAIYNSSYSPSPTNALYIAVGSSARPCGLRRFTCEGGSISCFTGGMEIWDGTHTDRAYNHNKLITDVRFRGTAEVRSAAFGGPANAAHYGLRRIVMTGGQVKGWLAGACNGNSDNGGQLYGTTELYVGGNAKVGDETRTITTNGSQGGNVFGAGRGRASSVTTGEVAYGTNVVIADNATIVRNVYGGGDLGYAKETANVHILGGTVNGSVFGGANSKQGEEVNIVMRGGLVKGGIYGGSNTTGKVENNVTMQILGGQVGEDGAPANIHGGGYGQPTTVVGNVDITIGKSGATTGPLIYGDVYGGSALGQVNANATVTINTTNPAQSTITGISYNNGTHTYVTMNKGTINGSLYGGALGSSTIAANVYGPVAVKVYGGTVNTTSEPGSGAVYGANNINGAPQRSVTVDIYGTDPAPSADAYALDAVYGGGNQANYTYGNGYPTVTVHGCDNSIGYVYGGGNAAAVAQTDVTIWGGNKIGNVFGGGNGQVRAANVNGGTNVKIYGGTIGDVYGGSNTNGNIGGAISVLVNAQAEGGNAACPIDVDNVYGGGNKAASAAGQITIGCAEHIGAVYGGANQANVTGNISLNIKAGNVDNVFGGNNNSGEIDGTITVNINEDKAAYPCGMAVGNVYGGGNKAAYTGSPTVNFVNGTSTGSVFGGGLGKTAVVVGDPKVNIGSWTEGSVIIGGDVFGGGDLAAVEGNPTVTIRDCDTQILGDLYGGGNAAPVFSTNTTMWGGLVAGNVFGGGNGKDATKNANGAQVGYQRDDTSSGGTGVASTAILGGTVGTWAGDVCSDGTGGVFGGSNTNGNIRGGIALTLDQQTCTEPGATQCSLKLREIYGAGNEAAYAGTGINFDLGCVDYLEEIYGGAKAADLNANTSLHIRSGHFKRVFGGNNVSGKLNGTITVTIEEMGCNPIVIDELYGGGNLAAYSVYGYAADGTPLTSGDAKADPQINILSCTHIGTVFGGGLGASAVMVGNPRVNIQEVLGDFPKRHYNPATKKVSNGTNGEADELGSIGTVFGGGNEAKVVGDTHILVGTEADKGAYILGNVYGGGKQADVTGKANVTVGRE